MTLDHIPTAALEHPIPEQTHQVHTRKTLPRKMESNSIGALWYRSDYELRWLRQAKKARCYWTRFLDLSGIRRALKGLPADQAVIAEAIMQSVALAEKASRELREWCERERALLRIARPAAQTVKTARHADRLDRETTATVVDVQEASQHTQ